MVRNFKPINIYHQSEATSQKQHAGGLGRRASTESPSIFVQSSEDRGHTSDRSGALKSEDIRMTSEPGQIGTWDGEMGGYMTQDQCGANKYTCQDER